MALYNATIDKRMSNVNHQSYYERGNAMNANKIQKSAVYEVKVGKNTTQVKVIKIDRKVNGTLTFLCGNVKTGKQMTVSDAARFIKAVKTKAAVAEKKIHVREDGTMSGLNAAHKVLTEEGRAMNAREIYETAVERGYCNLIGATPILTISAVIQLDIKKRGESSRFYKAGRGLFAAH